MATGALVIACCVLCLAASCRATSELQGHGLPQTSVGRCAAAHFDAFNWGDDEMLRAFPQEYRSPAYLLQHPAQERLAHHNRLRSIFGRLTPVGVALSLEFQLTLLVEPDKTGDALVVRFQLEEESPHYLAYVTSSGVDHLGVSELGHLARGVYRDVAKAGALADKLTEDAVALSHDLHLWVEAQEIVAAALADRAGCQALILDLRDSIGGEWCTAGLFLGYVLPGGTMLSRSRDRSGNLVQERAVPSAVPGVPFDGSIPVYVLTSSRTGSAAAST